MCKKFIYFFCINFLLAFNINSATNEDWESLYQVFDKDKVDLIRNYIDSKGIITTIYDLNAIEEIDINDIQKLKSYISVSPISTEASFSKEIII